jgi:hypothetical protein
LIVWVCWIARYTAQTNFPADSSSVSVLHVR